MAISHHFINQLAGVLAGLWYRLDSRHRRITLRNLEFAYGPELTPEARERLAREVFRQFVLFGFEVLELLLAPLSHIRRKVIILGQEHLAAALAQGRGAIAIAAHAGNWEYTVMGYGLQYGPEVVVGRELDHPLARRLARYLRERAGNRMIAKQRGLKEILRHLKQNHTVGIVIDQNTAAEEGLLVDFFGHPARTTPVAALLARRGGAGPAHPLPAAARRPPPDGDLPAHPHGEDRGCPGGHQKASGTPEPGHRGLGAGRAEPMALAAPALEEPVSGDL